MDVICSCDGECLRHVFLLECCFYLCNPHACVCLRAGHPQQRQQSLLSLHSSPVLNTFQSSVKATSFFARSSGPRLVGSSAGAGPSARQDGHPASRVVLRPHRGRSRAGHRTAWVRGARAGQGVLAVMLGEVTQNLYLIEIEQGNDHVRFILCHPSPF